MEENKAKAYYEANKEKFFGSEISHILVDTKEEAEKLLARLKDGEDFASLAKEASKCPSKEQGGSLGRMPDFFYVPGFAKGLAQLRENGQVVGPVQSQFGFHIIRQDGEYAPVPFEGLQEMIDYYLEKAPEQLEAKYDYPQAKQVEFTETLGGGYVNRDLYQWMEDKDGEEIKAWVAEENAYTDAFFDAAAVEEMAAQMKEAAVPFSYGIPVFAHGKLYTAKRTADGKTMPVVLDEDWNLLEEVGTELMDQLDLFGIAPNPVDPDQVSITAAPFGAHMTSLLVYSLGKKEILFRVDDAPSAIWTPDGALWYSQQLPHPSEGYMENPVWRKAPGEEPVKVYDCPKGRAYVTVTAGADNTCIIDSWFDFGSEELLRAYPDGKVESVTGDLRAKNAYCGEKDGIIYINTDDGAPLGKIVAGEKTIIPESSRMIVDAEVTEQGLLAAFMDDVCLRMELYTFDGKKIRDIELPDQYGSTDSFLKSFTRSTEKKCVMFRFQSFTTPPAIFAYDETAGEVKKLYSAYKDDVPEDVIVEEIFVTARDGERIPAFVVRRKDAKKDGTNPVHMYGYGGYNVGMPPAYENMVTGTIPWQSAMDGIIYVNCNMRGGNEYGSRWHEAAMLDKKMNAFYDFIDIAEYLIVEGWTSAGKIAISGCSNGGLLMSALTTLRPDLWGAVIDSVPHTDMLRFVNDPAGPRYILEYGNPREEMCAYLRKYSPYHNIRPIPYPPIYVQTGERDNNVPPYHGKKFAAKLQALGTGGPTLLRVLAEGAHNRGQGDVMFKTMAEMQLFMEKHLGI